jgi:pimeloyl-ACP methyl ester carboxylesterase
LQRHPVRRKIRIVEIPETRYSRSEDGVHIAYQVLGDSDLDLIVSPGFVSHLEHSWEEPHMARFFRRLASFSRLIVFDKRGTGMSDRSVDENAPLLEDRVNDIATLMDTVGSERAAIMGLSETGAVALLLAATYPERTRAVVAYGSFAGEGGEGPIYPWVPDSETAEWLEELEQNCRWTCATSCRTSVSPRSSSTSAMTDAPRSKKGDTSPITSPERSSSSCQALITGRGSVMRKPSKRSRSS